MRDEAVPRPKSSRAPSAAGHPGGPVEGDGRIVSEMASLEIRNPFEMARTARGTATMMRHDNAMVVSSRVS